MQTSPVVPSAALAVFIAVTALSCHNLRAAAEYWAQTSSGTNTGTNTVTSNHSHSETTINPATGGIGSTSYSANAEAAPGYLRAGSTASATMAVGASTQLAHD